MACRNGPPVRHLSRPGGRWSRWGMRGCRGGPLIETVLAMSVFALVGTTVLAGLSGTYRSGAATRQQSIAENIARNQMEYAFSLPYQDPISAYPPISTPLGYTATAIAQEFLPGEVNIELVVVTVQYSGADILALESLRTRE